MYVCLRLCMCVRVRVCVRMGGCTNDGRYVKERERDMPGPVMELRCACVYIGLDVLELSIYTSCRL